MVRANTPAPLVVQEKTEDSKSWKKIIDDFVWRLPVGITE